MKRALLGMAVASILLASRAAAQAGSPLAATLALAQEGRIDSARAWLKRLESTTPPTDSIFPGILYNSALLSTDVGEARRLLQRVVVEYPISVWAGEATIRLAQLDYANGDPGSALKQLERFRSDHAMSPLFAVAAVWGARAAFDAKDSASACKWVADGLGRTPADAVAIELNTLNRRCTGAGATPTPVASAPRPSSPSSPSSPAHSYRIQIAANPTQAAADQTLARARKAGFDGAIVEEKGYFKVRLGSYPSRAAAQAALANVKAKLGGDPFVVNP